jgi:H+/Cl- antiporter ClcA
VAWLSWSEAMGIKNQNAGMFVDYLFYIVFGTAFAGTAAWFVVNFSPWAAGSGIPEVKACAAVVV